MLPSSTVENYLKAIHQGQSALGPEQRLVPMGQVASALGVTPGTATTMVKALAESGLAEYEPYSGVRLSASGERLAGLVLRRHRLRGLFLVPGGGLRWARAPQDAPPPAPAPAPPPVRPPHQDVGPAPTPPPSDPHTHAR